MTWQQLFQNPLLAENPVVKKWVRTVLEHQSSLEHAAGGRLGEVLGCGHWGCVLDMPRTPWVLKLTVDPTEAHIWSKILSLMEDERYGEDGFPRFKKLFKLEPGIPYGTRGRKRIAYGIVREKVMPTFRYERKWGSLYLTDASKQVLGLDKLELPVPGKKRGEVVRIPRPISYRDLLSVPILQGSEHKVESFVSNIEALTRYREFARDYHEARYSEYGRTNWLRLCEREANKMNGPIGGPLGESLLMLASNNVVLNDVHQLNIGWRFLPEVEGIEGYPCLVVFDPGHTPTAKRPLPTEHWRQLAALG